MLNLLGVEIELGNSIYVTTEPEYIERRRHFTLAIGYCNALKDKLQEIISMINVSVGAYTNAGLLLKKEIDLLIVDANCIYPIEIKKSKEPNREIQGRSQSTKRE